MLQFQENFSQQSHRDSSIRRRRRATKVIKENHQRDLESKTDEYIRMKAELEAKRLNAERLKERMN
jgi:hypothetical protein